MIDYKKWMGHLYHRAKSAPKEEIPIAAMVLDDAGVVLAEACNRVEGDKNSLRHAEMVVLDQAMEKRGEKILPDCHLLVTLEPCAMCAQAIAHARIKTLVFGGYDKKSGGILSGARVFAHSHHKPEMIDGIMAEECENLMKEFFLNKR